MTAKDFHKSVGFGSFMERVLAPAAADKPKETSQTYVPIPNSIEFLQYEKCVEKFYDTLWVPVSKANFAAHQDICDAAIASAESSSAEDYWKKRRQPKMINGVPHIPLANALEAYDSCWADKHGLLDNDNDSEKNKASPQCLKFYTASAQLLAHVWGGKNADHIVKQLAEALHDPQADLNILTGKHSAEHVAETIYDLACAQRSKIKGSSPSI